MVCRSNSPKTWNFEIYLKLKRLNFQWWQFFISLPNSFFLNNWKIGLEIHYNFTSQILKVPSFCMTTFEHICEGGLDFGLWPFSSNVNYGLMLFWITNMSAFYQPPSLWTFVYYIWINNTIAIANILFFHMSFPQGKFYIIHLLTGNIYVIHLLMIWYNWIISFDGLWFFKHKFDKWLVQDGCKF